MKYFPLIWAALWRRKLRTWFTLISVVVAFFLFGMLQGVNLGLDGLFNILSTERLRSSGRINNSQMPLAHLQQMRSLPGVKAVTPLTAVFGSYQDPSNTVLILAVDIEAWFSVIYSPQMTMPPEALTAMQRTRNGIVVGTKSAERFNWHVGDHVPVQALNAKLADGSNAWDFEIVGIYDIPRAPQWATNILANYDYVNEARNADGKNYVMQYITRVDDPRNYQQVATAMDELFANSANQTITLSEQDFVRTTLAQLGNINYLLNGVVGAVLFTLLFLTANTMTLSVRERIPELAALKTLGFSNVALLVMVLIEVLLLCGVAGGLGLGASAFVFPKLMQTLGPQVGLEGLRIPWLVYGYGAAIATAVALVSGLPPALRAMRLNIVDGLANR